MHIVLEARSLSLGSRGVLTYTRELIRHLLTAGDHALTVLATSPVDAGVIAPAKTLVVPLVHDVLLPWWLNVQVPRALACVQPDVVHFTKADVPLRKCAVPCVVTLYDLIPLLFPASQAISRRFYWPWALKRAAAMSDHVITISETSKRDIVNYLQVDPENVTATPLAVAHDHFFPVPNTGERITSLRLRHPYILFLGTRDQRKNVGALIRAFSLIARDVPHHLVVVGREALKRDAAEHDLGRRDIAGRVHTIPHVPYMDLPAVYSGASVFVFPSVYEGWGLPPLEAMACGVPVIVSDGGALPEVVGNAGEIVPFSHATLPERLHDAAFERDLADRLRMVLSDTAQQEVMRRRGIERARQFSWERVAGTTLDVYRKLCRA